MGVDAAGAIVASATEFWLPLGGWLAAAAVIWLLAGTHR